MIAKYISDISGKYKGKFLRNMIIMSKSYRTLILLIIGILLLSSYVNAAETGVGMIMETKGNVRVNGKKAKIMQPLFANSRIITGSGEKMSFVSYLDKKEYCVEPDSEIVIKAQSFDIIKGSINCAINRKNVPLPKNTTLISRKVIGDMIRNFDESPFKIVTPEKGMLIATNQIPFKWKSLEGQYEIDLIEKASGKHLENFPSTKQYQQGLKEFDLELEYGKSYVFTIQEIPENKNRNGEVNEIRVVFHLMQKSQALKVQEDEKKYKDLLENKSIDQKRYLLLMIDYYKENGMYHQAIELLNNFMCQEKDNPFIYYYLADMYVKTGDKCKAMEMIEQGEKLEDK